jgi:dihydrofolate reductase
MSKVFVSVSMTLDGYMAPRGMDMAHAGDPEYQGWMAKWSRLQDWVFPQEFFRQNLGLGEGGETGADNEIVRRTYERTGVSIMGKRMFELGERLWPDEAPFHTPVFVLTHESRQPWVRPGGTTFYFVNDGVESALEQAREVSGERDIRISGGANAIVQYLNAGLVDELAIDLAPVVFDGGHAPVRRS